MENKIELAISPLKNDAVKSALAIAHDDIESVKKNLEASGWDREKVASYPASNWATPCKDYQMKVEMYKFVCSITAGDDSKNSGSRKLNDPYFVVMSNAGIDNYLEMVARDAGSRYVSFVAKMVKKIGDVADASLEGNHVWGNSILTITREDGSRERWFTQQIINVSKWGRLFNQWPSRKMKG
jgi:hypothetical protein